MQVLDCGAQFDEGRPQGRLVLVHQPPSKVSVGIEWCKGSKRTRQKCIKVGNATATNPFSKGGLHLVMRAKISIFKAENF